MENSFLQLVDSASSILVLLPNKPYFDQVAAGLALYLSLHDMASQTGKKETVISCATPMVVGFNRLIGVNKIGAEIGNKNLTIKFKGYEAENIEKVSYDIIDGEFNLTVSPKQGLPSPKKEQVDLGYAGMSADLAILIGGTNDGDFEALSAGKLSEMKIAHIGTRVLNVSSGVTPLSFAKPASSVSEIVAELIKDCNLPIDPDVATNLLMGIEEGSSRFESQSATPETFEMFAFLLRKGGTRPAKKEAEDFPPGAIPGMQVFNQGEDVEGTKETEQEINPPSDWLQPKVYKGATSTQPDSFSENKG